MNKIQAAAVIVATTLYPLGAGAQGPRGSFGTCRELVAPDAMEPINTPFAEWGASLTRDEKTMVFASTRRLGGWNDDLYLAYRESKDGPFTFVRPLSELNTNLREMSAHISSDGLRIYFDQQTTSGGPHKLFFAERGNAEKETLFGSKNEDPFVRINVFDSMFPSLTEDELILTFVIGQTIYEARRTRNDREEAFDTIRQCTEVEGGQDYPSISSDGLTLFVSGIGGTHHDTYEIWMAHRDSRDDPPGSGIPMPFSADWRVSGCLNAGGYVGLPAISPRWPAEGSKIIFSRYISDSPRTDLWEADWNPEASDFIRGDPNADGDLNIADAVFVLSYLFGDGPAASCEDAADANDDGAVDIADAIASLDYLFGGGGDLPAPFRECGADPTPDALGCEAYAPCQER